MPDLAQTWGNDLSATPAGDLATVDGTQLGIQRVYRRLMTNPGDYIFHPSYGAGLLAMVGTTIDTAAVAAVIRAQLLQETCVAPNPPPTVVVTEGADQGTFTVAIGYVDAVTGEQASLSFDPSGD